MWPQKSSKLYPSVNSRTNPSQQGPKATSASYAAMNGAAGTLGGASVRPPQMTDNSLTDNNVLGPFMAESDAMAWEIAVRVTKLGKLIGGGDKAGNSSQGPATSSKDSE